MKPKNDENVLKFVEGLGIKLYPWQEKLLVEMAKQPAGTRIFVNGVRGGRTHFGRVIKALVDNGYHIPMLENIVVVRKSDMHNNGLGFRTTHSFIDEDVANKFNNKKYGY